MEIITKSYTDAPAQRWTCDGSPAYTLEECDRQDRGTDIVMHLSEDSKEFLEKMKMQDLLHKFCRFLPVPVVYGKKQEWRDGKMQDTDEDNVVNDTNPLWTRKPADLKDDDYKAFYRSLYPASDDPLFWIHLNVDYPFNLTGILYFPKISNPLDLQRNKIQLYCNQVFVTDNVEGIVPDFLTLLHGVIDSPDIPLNVSRSYLQGDPDVKKISTYITKKVSDRLAQLFKADRPAFEQKWNDIKIFIHYGMLSQDDFYDKAQAYFLLKDTDGKSYTLEEYRTLVKDIQTDKDGQLICLYAQDAKRQHSYIKTSQAKGYNTLLLDGQLDIPLLSLLERKLDKTTFTRVDADTIDSLIRKDEAKESGSQLEAEQVTCLTAIFRSLMPHTSKLEVNVETKPLGQGNPPVTLVQSEYKRRMKELARVQAGMSFYGDLPDNYTLVLNTAAPLIRAILAGAEAETSESLRPVLSEIKGIGARLAIIRQEREKKSEQEISEADTKLMKECTERLRQEEQKRDEILAGYAAKDSRARQLSDLALLQAGLLQGEDLTSFINRSIDLIK